MLSTTASQQHHFNSPDVSQQYDDQPLHTEMANRIGKALLKAYTFDDEQTTVLDFACGTGLNSRVLAPYAKTIIGIDISQEMVDRYNTRVTNQGIEPEEMRAICVPENLLDNPEESRSRLKNLLGGIEFDVAICCMSYHHFASITSATRTLSSLLKPGGYLYVADVESIPAQPSAPESDTNAAPHSAFNREPIFPQGACEAGIVVHKYGFSKLEMLHVFVEAGLAELDEKTGQANRFGYDIVTRAFKNGKAVNIFLASGIKLLE
ncbi:S-adenosyl-L-methionine-dependent methyltransferase [Lentinula raphanica]|nr:S-adenosyl-L-methionine-dependent methyltransferase [Lentinula raphanica]